MAGSLIPTALESAVLEQAITGSSNRAVAAWLKDKHGIEVSHVTVGRMVKRLRSERADIAKAVIREKLGTSLTTDLDRLEKHARQLDELADDCFGRIKSDATFAKGHDKTGEPIYVDGHDTYAKLVEQIRKITDTKLDYSGAGQDDEAKMHIGPVIMVPTESDD